MTDPDSSNVFTIWLTGLPSAGKTTLARRVLRFLRSTGARAELLDGDEVRRTLCADLGFSRADREQNIRRIGFVAELLLRNEVIVVVSAISPYRAVRDEMRQRLANFIEVFVNASVASCEQRDVKGLYERYRRGEITGLSGMDDPYEPPRDPEVECRTDRETEDESLAKVVSYIQNRFRWLSLQESFEDPLRSRTASAPERPL